MQFRRGLARFLGVALVLALMAGMTTTTFAQGTPEASPTGSGGGPLLGDAVVLFDPNGEELAQIAVTQIVDPYEDADDATRGFHWVAIEIVIMNSGEAEFQPNVYDIQLVDDLGFATSPGYAPRDQEVSESQPEYLGEPVPVGETMGGWLFYEVIDDATVTQVVNSQPYGDGNFTLLANLGSEIPAEGGETTFYFSDASEAGTIAINEIIPTFEDVDSSVDAERGTTVVALDLTITNTSDDEMESNTYGLLIVDEYGYAYSQSFLFREDAESGDFPDFPTDPIPAGESAEGVVLFELPSDAVVTYVVYSPDSSMLYILAQPGEGSVVSGETLEPVTPSTDPDEDEPTEEAGDTGGTESAECEGVGDWVDASNDALQPLIDELDFLDQDLADVPPDDLRDAADVVADVRADMEEIDTPDAAADVQDALLIVLDEFEASFDEIAGRIEDGDDPEEIQADMGDPDGDLMTAFDDIETAIDDLETACPDSDVEELNF